ncbi:MAG: hypothetical protein R2731_04850 [Nocardioides sp.]
MTRPTRSRRARIRRRPWWLRRQQTRRQTRRRRQPSSRWVRRRRLAEVFGDVLPEQPSDDRGGGATPDAWWRDQVPPHHG